MTIYIAAKNKGRCAEALSFEKIGGPNGNRTRVLALRVTFNGTVQVLENTRKTLASHGFEPLFCFDIIPQISMGFDTFISRFLHGQSLAVS
ncbi:MAG: hypothetical protein HZB62_00130 [Nitrospirae bacterium]|nr:hypothetical protein [Nitrospirota bacterium]